MTKEFDWKAPSGKERKKKKKKNAVAETGTTQKDKDKENKRTKDMRGGREKPMENENGDDGEEGGKGEEDDDEDDENASFFRVSIRLWDIAGQDRFAKLTRPYFRRAAGAVIVSDVTRPGTLEAAARWKAELDDKCPGLPVLLLANKVRC